MTPEQLIEIEERANKATAGPWISEEHGYEWELATAQVPDEPVGLGYLDGVRAEPDATFIAAARTDVPALCQALKDAWKDRDTCRLALAHILVKSEESSTCRIAETALGEVV